RTIRTITSTTQYQQWTGTTYASGIVKQYPGTAHRLLNHGASTTELIGISIPTDGRPSFYKLDSSFEIVAPAALEKPGFLTATSLAATQAVFSWADVSGETAYLIERKTGAGGTWTQVGTTTVSSTSYTDATVSLGNEYYYRVIAQNGALQSPASDELYMPVTAPPVPANLAAVANSYSAITVTWSDVVRETGYKLEYATASNGPWTQATAPAANAVSYQFTSLNQSTEYFFRLRSSNQIGDSAYSATASATTLAAPPFSPYIYVSSATYSRVILVWNDVAFEDSYVIERAPGGTSTWEALSTVLANVTTYTDNAVAASTSYSYRIKAVNTAGSSNWSTTSATTPAPTPPLAPGGISLRIISSSQLRLTWADVTDETSYQIERRTDDPLSWVLLTSVAAGTTLHDDLTVVGGVQYWYRIKSVNAHGSSAASATVTGTPVNIYQHAQDDFDPTPDSSLWASITSGAATNGGAGFLGSNALWFGASGTRTATTVPLNFLQAGYVEFSFRAGNQSVDGATYWNNSESGESVVIEYSLDGVTWTTFQTLNTLYPNHSTWTNYYLPVPAAALTSTTRLRWRQLAHSGGTNDTWALENVSIHSGSPVVTVGPEIELLEGTTNLSSGFSNVSYGSVNVELTSSKTFTLKNTGTQSLTGVAVTVTGGHATDFTLGSVPTTLAAGAEISFDLTFDPQATGARGASLSIASNDSDENPFIVALTGYVTTNAQIVVESPPGSALSSGVSTLNFGSVLLSSYNQQTVTIRNSGTAPLTQLAVSVINGTLSSFGNTALGVTTLAPGAFASFQVVYSPVAVGPLSATLRITSSDPEDSPFNVQLTGSGRIAQAPSFTLQPNSQLALLGGSVSFSPVITGDSPMTYQWRKGAADIAGARQQSHTISITKAADIGAYSVIADNPVGASVPSITAYLGLVTPISGEQTLRLGAALSLRCTATAPTVNGISLTYAWKRDDTALTNGTQPNGAVIVGADKATLTISKLGEDDSGGYTCHVTLATPSGNDVLANGEMQIHVVSDVPEVNPVPLSTLSVSQTIDELVTATNFPTAFSATGLPKGWKLDPKTGRITGKATEPSKKDTNGDYIPNIITFKASNPIGTGPGLPVPVVIEALDAGSTGNFYGFVARAGHSNFGMGGHVQITITSTGVVTGFATLAGQRHSITGVLDVPPDADPTASLRIVRSPASLGNLTMDVQLLPNEQLLRGNILDPQFEIMPGTLILGDPAEPDLVNGGISVARFSSPKGMVLRADGAGYIADSGNHSIRFVDPEAGTVVTFAGDGTAGAANGTGATARFSSPEGLALDASGNLYVADTGNSTIRRITPSGLVSTIAGASGQTGVANGLGLSSRFNQPSGLCLDPAGNLYVVDRGNHTIRRINPAGAVTTFAGTAGVSGHKDGAGASALFSSPHSIAYDPALKALFVTDSANEVIRKITLSGAVSTYAGSPGVPGFDDGLLLGARFESPLGITSLGNGTLIITDTVLRQINASGLVGTLSNRIDPADHPVAIAYDASDESLIVVHDSLHGASSHIASGPAQNATFTARRASWSTAVPVSGPLVGVYNAALETTAAGDNLFPQGDGYAQLTLTKTGASNWSGRSADGSTFTFGTFMSADNIVPLHAMLYKNTGSLQGECFIDSLSRDITSQDSPGFDWYKVGQPLVSLDRPYKAGFNAHPLRLFGGKFLPSDLHAYLGLTTTPAPMQAVLSDSTISGFSQSFTLADPNTVSVPTNAKGLTLLIDAKSGLFTGSFKEGSPALAVPFAGILIDFNAESIRAGYGHYLLPISAAKTAPIESSRIRLEAD
ncbi:MAG: choice-of-anchor D domain-containing protein, partial [Prosthecobacter sp.]